MTANLHVARAAGRSRTFQFRPNLSVVRSRLSLERQHIEARHEMLDSGQVIDTASRFLRAIMQLAERDAGDAELLGQCVEFPQQVRRIILRPRIYSFARNPEALPSGLPRISQPILCALFKKFAITRRSYYGLQEAETEADALPRCLSTS